MANEIDTTDDLKAARTQTCWNIGLLAALTVISMASFGYALFIYEPTGAVDLSPIIKETRERIVANADTIAREGIDLAKETVPPVARTFYAQFERDVPIYLEALEAQGDRLLDEVAADMRTKLKEQYKEFIAQHRKILAEEFPKYASKEAIQRFEASIDKAIDRLIDRYYIDEFRKEARLTTKLWRSIEPVAPPNPPDTLEKQLLEYAGDWTVLKARETVTE